MSKLKSQYITVHSLSKDIYPSASLYVGMNVIGNDLISSVRICAVPVRCLIF